MTRQLVASLLLVTILTACQAGGAGPSGSNGPSPAASGQGGVDGLVADLVKAGVPARAAGSFSTDPIGGTGSIVCIDKEPIHVYVFESEAARQAVASKIDRTDPSNIGTAIVEWVGWPKFFERDRIIALYLGSSAATTAVLTTVMGPPFSHASGAGAPPLRGPECG